MAKAIPAGFHSVTPSLTLKDSKQAIEFYQKAFGAKLIDSFPGLNGQGIMHAVIQIGDSFIMMGDEMQSKDAPKSAETLGACPMHLFVYVHDADATFRQAVAAGAQVTMPMADMFWGDRSGSLKDPFGYEWIIATHKQDLSKEEIRQNAEAFFAQFAQK